MPITFSVNEDQSAIVATASGVLGREEVLEYVRAKAQAGVLGYAELFDAREANIELSVSDLQGIADEVKQAMGAVTPAKIAVVTNNNFIYGIASTYKELTAAQNPQLEVFRNFEKASSWLFGS